MALRAKKYFRDYHRVQSLDPSGQVKSKLQYGGDYYVRMVSPKARSLERHLYVVLGVLGFLSLILAMNRPIAPNISGRITQAVSILALVPGFCVAEGAVEAFFRKGDLKKENYRERLLMLRVMALLGAALALVLVVSYGRYAVQDPQGGLGAVCLSLGTAVFFGAIGVRELRVPYQVRKAPPRPLEQGDQEDPEQYFD